MRRRIVSDKTLVELCDAIERSASYLGDYDLVIRAVLLRCQVQRWRPWFL